jgi:hypothetical protein
MLSRIYSFDKLRLCGKARISVIDPYLNDSDIRIRYPTPINPGFWVGYSEFFFINHNSKNF